MVTLQYASIRFIYGRFAFDDLYATTKVETKVKIYAIQSHLPQIINMYSSVYRALRTT